MADVKVPENVLASVYGSVPAEWRQHKNGGGWIYKTATVGESAYLHPTSIVYGNAWVYGNAQVYGNAWVYGDARVSGDAWEQSPLYIQGSRHALTLCSLTQIAVGCHVHDIPEWLKRFRVIGRSEGYTKEQIAEYGVYLKLLADTAKRLQVAAKKKVKATV